MTYQTKSREFIIRTIYQNVLNCGKNLIAHVFFFWLKKDSKLFGINFNILFSVTFYRLLSLMYSNVKLIWWSDSGCSSMSIFSIFSSPGWGILLLFSRKSNLLKCQTANCYQLSWIEKEIFVCQ